MKKGLLWCLKACAAASVSLVILSLFTLLYSHTGVHITNESRATDYKWEAGQFRSTMTEGFSWLKMNDDGFNNAFDIKDIKQIDVLLMGSSHMEAVNVSQNKNCAYLLNRMFDDKVIYNIGISGHTIYHCVNNLAEAVECYHPKGYVVIETDSVEMDENEMNQVLGETLPCIPSHDEGLKYKVQKYIPCFLPLYRAVSNWVRVGTIDSVKVAEASTIAKIDAPGSYEKVLDSFAKRIIESVGDCKVIVVYQPTTSIDENGVMIEPNKELISTFLTACDNNGIVFVNMYDDFSEKYDADEVLAHGFINTAIGSGHLNDVGHRLMAERLSTVIKELEDGTE